MSKTSHTVSVKSGLPPASLVHVGEKHGYVHAITVINYNTETFRKKTLTSIDEVHALVTDDTITWVIIDGLHDVRAVEGLGQLFNIDGLVLEDILNTHQRPKLEEYSNFLYIVIKSLALVNHRKITVKYEQLSIIILKNVILTFKEKPDTVLDVVIERMAVENSPIRQYGADYLAYLIMDAVVDEYFTLQDRFDEFIVNVEDELLTNPTPKTLYIIQKIKRELIYLRRTVTPMRELFKILQRSNSAFIQEDSRRYFGDVYDHSIRISEAVDSYRDLITGMLDIYLSSISNKMNETMKILTVFSSIFIPLTFIAGIYGMNFHYMPELEWRWGYPAIWVVFIVVTIALLAYFKRKNWL
jgi:magnesium transporter